VREGMILVATDFSKNKKIQDLCPGFDYEKEKF